MLAPSPATRDHCREPSTEEDEFLDFADDGDLLDIIDFDDLFGVAGDVLPDLELLSGDFSDHMNASSRTSSEKTDSDQGETNKGILGISEEVVISKRDDEEIGVAETVTYDGESDRKRKYSFSGVSKNNRISNKEVLKRKVKVDWTAELHRRFVEAVELLGLDKAVPSRILELMGVHSLTRHNVASHLQKYRSHRKHLLAREAEAANWTRKRHMYGGADNVIGRNKNGWLAPAAPTLGFPPPHVHHQHNFRPLHVWGHPTVDHLAMSHHVWPKHLPPPSTAMPYQPFWIFDSLCLHPRFKAQSVAGIPKTLPPYDMVYKPDHHGSRPPLDLHPTKERVDAAIGDVLTRPWLPLPLGLKPPAIDSVMKELHCHGVSEVPMTASCA